jgi:hypothetical protein
MFVVPWVLLFIADVGAGLVCFAITSRWDDRRYQRQLRDARAEWHSQLSEYAGFFLDTGLDDAVARWADQM